MLREFAVEECGWRLVEHDKLVAFVETCGAVTISEGRKWEFGIPLMGAPALVLYTDLPHPDDARVKAVYVLELVKGLQAAAKRLHEASLPLVGPGREPEAATVEG